jgi:UDP-N-acetylglucosamine:LPS N-acetylglucosamine transferase
VAQQDVTDEYFDSVVLPLLGDDARRESMAAVARTRAVTDAAETFAEMVWAARKGARF